jgi:hypothetical protein
MKEIITAVKKCPSGALSYAVDGVECRDAVDQVREPTITVSKDGPYRITGGIRLKDEQGNEEPRAGRLAGALQLVSLRPLEEQTVLQRHAWVLQRPRREELRGSWPVAHVPGLAPTGTNLGVITKAHHDRHSWSSGGRWSER